MKEKRLFTCEICGTDYADKQKALECENFHHKPVSIRSTRYHAAKSATDGYPDRVEIVFQDGKAIYYKR